MTGNLWLRGLIGTVMVLALAALIGCGGGVKEEVAVLTTDLGEVVLGFYPDEAPQHVENFKNLARQGVYDGTLFHRVVPGFVIQGGDPGTKDPNTPRRAYGTGGTGNKIPLEVGEKKHLRGSLGMARSRERDSADSQFYIALTSLPQLDGNYTVFGEVLRGMEVVDSIATAETDFNDVPMQNVAIQSVKIVPKSEAGL